MENQPKGSREEPDHTDHFRPAGDPNEVLFTDPRRSRTLRDLLPKSPKPRNGIRSEHGVAARRLISGQAADNVHIYIDPLTRILSFERDDCGNLIVTLTGFPVECKYTASVHGRVSKIMSQLGQSKPGGRVSPSHSTQVMQKFQRDLGMLGFASDEAVSAEAYGPQVNRVLNHVLFREAAKVTRWKDDLVQVTYTDYLLDGGEIMFGKHAADAVEQDVSHYPHLMLLEKEATALFARRDHAVQMQLEVAKKNSDPEEQRARKARDDAEFLQALQKLAFMRHQPIPNWPLRFSFTGRAAVKAIQMFQLLEPTRYLTLERKSKNDAMYGRLSGFQSATPYSTDLQKRVNDVLREASIPSLGGLPTWFNADNYQRWLAPFRHLEYPLDGAVTSAHAYGREVWPIMSLLRLKRDPEAGGERFHIKAILHPSGAVEIYLGNIFIPVMIDGRGRMVDFGTRVFEVVKQAYTYTDKKYSQEEAAFKKMRSRALRLDKRVFADSITDGKLVLLVLDAALVKTKRDDKDETGARGQDWVWEANGDGTVHPVRRQITSLSDDDEMEEVDERA